MKRIFDFFLSIFFSIILFPLLLLISCCLIIFYGRPIFFLQVRAGFKGKPFKIIKFRTYKNDSNEISGTFALILRKFKLDELPQLINIIKGEISFVGPRPLYIKYIKLYNYSQKKRLDVKPGLTGLAQINGGNKLKWTKKFEFDTYYVENQNFFLDIKILSKTIILLIVNIFSNSNNLRYSEQDDFKGN
tara:strand:- start:6082 stop:6648 length:567 start_codon:yes stop_codon:yes gene_type:complete